MNFKNRPSFQSWSLGNYFLPADPDVSTTGCVRPSPWSVL